jgi:hypothetical protein
MPAARQLPRPQHDASGRSLTRFSARTLHRPLALRLHIVGPRRRADPARLNPALRSRERPRLAAALTSPAGDRSSARAARPPRFQPRDCQSDGVRAQSCQDLTRGEMVPMHRINSVEPQGASAARPERPSVAPRPRRLLSRDDSDTLGPRPVKQLSAVGWARRARAFACARCARRSLCRCSRCAGPRCLG